MAGVQQFATEQVIQAIHDGHTPTGAAAVLKCHPDTIRNYARRYTTVKDALLSERRSLVDLAELGLRNALLNSEPWTVTSRQRDGQDRVQRQELSGPNGAELFKKMSDDELKRYIADAVGTNGAGN